MNHTTADYLNQLEQDRQDLVDNLETQGITGLSGDETFTELVPEVLNIEGGGADLSDYFTSTIGNGASSSPGYTHMIKNIPSTTTVSGTSLECAFYGFRGTELPVIDTSNVTNLSQCFSNCLNLVAIPAINTQNVTNFYGMCLNSANLVTVPVLNTSKAKNMQAMFMVSSIWSNESLNNILAMCVGATSYTGTKTLAYLGLSSTYYPASRIQGLSNYQAFIDAGWTIGW